MTKTSTLVLGGTGNLEITRDPAGSNIVELTPKDQIVNVAGIFNEKPSNAELAYNTPSVAFAIGDTVLGVTSGATGVIVGFKGTTILLLENVVGEFDASEGLIINEGTSGAGTAAGPGSFAAITGATSGAGTGISLDVTAVGVAYTVITIVDPGVGYLVGDTITIVGTDLGGATPLNDLVVTLTGDTAVATTDSVNTLSEGEWPYRYDTMTVVQFNLSDGSRLNIELQEVSNQVTWNLGTQAALQTAMAAINAWL